MRQQELIVALIVTDIQVTILKTLWGRPHLKKVWTRSTLHWCC